MIHSDSLTRKVGNLSFSRLWNNSVKLPAIQLLLAGQRTERGIVSHDMNGSDNLRIRVRMIIVSTVLSGWTGVQYCDITHTWAERKGEILPLDSLLFACEVLNPFTIQRSSEQKTTWQSFPYGLCRTAVNEVFEGKGKKFDDQGTGYCSALTSPLPSLQQTWALWMLSFLFTKMIIPVKELVLVEKNLVHSKNRKIFYWL